MKRLFSNGWVFVLVMLMASGAFADRKVAPNAACDVCLKTSSDGTFAVNWNAETVESSSLRDEEAVFHDGSFEGQIGCGGGCAFSVRFTAESPIFLTGVTLFTQGGNATGAVVSIYADPASGIAGPPTLPIGPGDGSALWESDPMDFTTIGEQSQFDIVIDNLTLETGDYYVVVWENDTGFLGIGNDLQTNYLDRNWAYAGDVWSTINDAVAGDPTLTGNFAISAMYLPQVIDGPFMTVNPRNINFGILQIDDGVVSQNVTIGNIGTEAFDVTTIDIVGLDYTTSLATPVTVAAGESVVMDVTLTPSAEGVANGTFTITSTATNVTEIVVNASATVFDGFPEYLVWNPVATISGPAFTAGLEGLGYTAIESPDLFMFGNPLDAEYSAVFVCLGIYPDNYVLVEGSAEVQALLAFAEAGYPLYMEGGDTWAFDPQTSLHSVFGIDGVADGGADLTMVEGETLLDGMDYSYFGSNSFIDHLAPLSVDAMVFHVNPADVQPCGIGNLTPGANTIGNSFEFGGLVDSVGTVSELLAAYLEFLAMPYTDLWSPTVGGVTRFTFTMDQEGPYSIEAFVTDNVGVAEVTLYYNLDNGAFLPVTMTDQGEGIYSGDIPGQDAGTTVAYYVMGVDDVGNSGYAPVGAPTDLYVFSVVSHLPPVYVEAMSGLDGTVELNWLVPGTEAPPLLDCADYPVTELPFNTTGNNLGMLDDFDVSGSDGEDVAYQLWMLEDGVIDITLCSPTTDFDCKVEIFTEDCSISTGYYDDDGPSCPESPATYGPSELLGVFLPAGIYLVVVDGFSGATGNYELFITASDAARAPAESFARDLSSEIAKLQTSGSRITPALLSSSPREFYSTRELRELTNYGIYRNTTSPVIIEAANLVEVIPMDPLAYTDFPLANEITYYYRILAIYDDGESASEQVEALPTNHPPMRPLNLVGSVDDETSNVTLDWDDNTDYDLASYNVYRADVLIGNVTESTFSEIIEDGAHRYVIKALDTGGMESEASGHVQVLVGEVPPTYPTALSGLDGRIDLAWSPPGTELFTVTVEIMTDIFGGETSWDIIDEAGNFIAGVATGELASSTLYTWDVELSPATYIFTIYDTFGDGIYIPSYYSVYLNGSLLITGGGDFDFSESVTFDPSGILALRRGHYDDLALGPKGTIPTNIASLNIINETIYENQVTRELRDLLNYGIYRSTTSPVLIDAEHLVEVIGMELLNYTDFPLVNGTTYYYQILAIYDSGTAASDEFSGVPQNHPPMTPLNLTGEVDNAINTVTLNWDDNTDYDLAGYHVYRDEVMVGTAPESTFEQIVVDGAYYYTVKSYDTGNMESDASERIQVLVGEVPPSDLTADGDFDDHIALSWRVPGNPAPPLLDCGDELINSLPFWAAGTNVGMGDDFDVAGGTANDNEDYAYQLYMPQDGTIDITLCGPATDYDTRLEVFNGDCITSTGYVNDDGPFGGCPESPAPYTPSELTGIFLTEGVYLIVVDGFYAAAGNYEITVNESNTQRQYAPESSRETLKKLVMTGAMPAGEAEALLAAEEVTDFAPQFVALSAELADLRETEEILHYTVYRDGSVVGTSTETTYNDAVEEDMPYFYQVTATYENQEESAPSNTVEARANMAPGVPSHFHIEDTGHTVALTWWDPSVNMDFSPCFDLEGLEIRRNGSLISTADPLQREFVDFGLPDGHYVYEVSAFDEVGNIGAPVIGEAWVGPRPVIVQVFTDNYPTESSWNVYNSSTQVVASIATGELTEAGVLYEWPLVLEPGVYLFEMNDSYGDGIFAPGYYQVLHGGNVLVGPGADFGVQEITPFTVESTILMGDLDGDGFLNILDLTRYLEVMMEVGDPPTLDELSLMDINGDGNHNILDVVILVETILDMGGLSKDNPIIEDISFAIPQVTLNNSREWQNIPVTSDCFEMISGFQIDLLFDASIVELGVPVLAEGNENVGVFTSISGNTMRVLAIDLSGGLIDLSSGLLMNVPVQVIDETASGSLDFSVEDLIISGPGGVQIVAQCLVSIIDIGLPSPTEFSLKQNFPNPFNPTTSIRYDIAETADANLVIYNMLGQQVRTLVNGKQDVGYYQVVWNGLNDAGQPVATGIYIYHLQAGQYSKTMKMAFIK